MKVKFQARLSFNDLFEATEYKGDGKFKYRATFIVDPGSDGDKAIKDAIKAVTTEKWKDKAANIVKGISSSKKDFCYIDGDLSGSDSTAGKMVLSATRQKADGRPDIRDRNASPLTEDDNKLYSGCYVVGVVDVWAQDNAHGKGVRASLLGVQFVKDGQAFRNIAKANDDDFADLGVEEEDEMFS